MRRSFYWRIAAGFVVATLCWFAMAESAAAHCLGGESIYKCCYWCRGDASTGRTWQVAYDYGRPYRYGYGKAYGRPEIHRRQLSARNRNGGIK
jgi:hypothetical protein